MVCVHAQSYLHKLSFAPVSIYVKKPKHITCVNRKIVLVFFLRKRQKLFDVCSRTLNAGHIYLYYFFSILHQLLLYQHFCTNDFIIKTIISQCYVNISGVWFPLLYHILNPSWSQRAQWDGRIGRVGGWIWWLREDGGLRDRLRQTQISAFSSPHDIINGCCIVMEISLDI